MTTQVTIQGLRLAAARFEADARKLHEVHGQGVRPGWVSTDLAIARKNADDANRAADILELHAADNLAQLQVTWLQLQANGRGSAMTQELYAARAAELVTEATDKLKQENGT